MIIYTDTLGRTVRRGDEVICFTKHGSFVRKFGPSFLKGVSVCEGVEQLCYVLIDIGGENKLVHCETQKIVEHPAGAGKAASGRRQKRSRRRKRSRNLKADYSTNIGRDYIHSPKPYTSAHTSQSAANAPERRWDVRNSASVWASAGSN